MFGISLVMGIAAAFNILIIFKKIEKKRRQDAFFDATLLVVLSLVFGGSLGGMLVATVASAIISLYFLYNEPKIFPSFNSAEKPAEQQTTYKTDESASNEFDDLLAKYGI